MGVFSSFFFLLLLLLSTLIRPGGVADGAPRLHITLNGVVMYVCVSRVSLAAS